MTIDNKLFDDLTRMASGAANIMTGIGKQIGSGLKDQLKDQMSGKFSGFPFAPFGGFGGAEDSASGGPDARDENAPNDFNRLLAMVSHYRLEQEAIKERLSVIEKALGIEAAPPKTASKAASKAAGKSEMKVKAEVKKSPVSKAAKTSKAAKKAEPVQPVKPSKAPAKPKAKKTAAVKA